MPAKLWSEHDCLLDELGMKQTAFTATRQPEELKIGGAPVDVVYVSPMRRCLVTAIRGFRHQAPAFVVVPELREKNGSAGSENAQLLRATQTVGGWSRV